MCIGLNQILGAQATQARPKRKQLSNQQRPSPNGIGDIFWEINPARPISQLPSAVAAASLTSGLQDAQGATFNPTASDDLFGELITNQATRGTSDTSREPGNADPNISDYHVSLSDLKKLIPAHLRDLLASKHNTSSIWMLPINEIYKKKPLYKPTRPLPADSLVATKPPIPIQSKKTVLRDTTLAKTIVDHVLHRQRHTEYAP